MSSDDFARLYSKNIHDLYEELGRAFATSEVSTTAPISRQDAVERGQIFFSKSREKLKEKICVEWNYCGKRGDYGNVQTLVYAISPLISSAAGVPGATAIIVATILIKMGLDHFCNCPQS